MNATEKPTYAELIELLHECDAYINYRHSFDVTQLRRLRAELDKVFNRQKAGAR